nr:hypothetical protein [Comamonas thiooxydans]
MQADLFSAAALACTVQVPPAPMLNIARYQAWPSPGCTPRECAQAGMALSDEYADMLAAVIKTQGGNQLSSDGVMALIPDDWRKLMGKYLHASMVEWKCKPRGIELSYLMRPDGFPVFMYQAKEGAQQG